MAACLLLCACLCAGLARDEMGGSPATKHDSDAEEEKKGKGKAAATGRQKSPKEKVTFTPQVTTQQSSLAHMAAVKARDKAYQVQHCDSMTAPSCYAWSSCACLKSSH
jgi:hypothetical protein